MLRWSSIKGPAVLVGDASALRDIPQEIQELFSLSLSSQKWSNANNMQMFAQSNWGQCGQFAEVGVAAEGGGGRRK